jgi:hypothetical protein
LFLRVSSDVGFYSPPLLDFSVCVLLVGFYLRSVASKRLFKLLIALTAVSLFSFFFFPVSPLPLQLVLVAAFLRCYPDDSYFTFVVAWVSCTSRGAATLALSPLLLISVLNFIVFLLFQLFSLNVVTRVCASFFVFAVIGERVKNAKEARPFSCGLRGKFLSATPHRHVYLPMCLFIYTFYSGVLARVRTHRGGCATPSKQETHTQKMHIEATHCGRRMPIMSKRRCEFLNLPFFFFIFDSAFSVFTILFFLLFTCSLLSAFSLAIKRKRGQ